jgi:cell division protein FtsQ
MEKLEKRLLAVGSWHLAKGPKLFCRESAEQLAISNWQLADPSSQQSAVSTQQGPETGAYHRFTQIFADPDLANSQEPKAKSQPVSGLTNSQEPKAKSLGHLHHSVTENGRGTPDDRAIHFEDLDTEDDDQFLRTEKRVAVRRSPLPKKTANRVKKTVIIVSTCAVLGLAAWVTYKYGVQSWRFRLESSDNIEISGVQNVSRAEVMDAFGGDISRNIFSVVLEERKRKLEEIPWVESATVMRLLPNRLAVTIRERTPVAFVHMGSKISLIDANGVVMGLPANKQARYSFPVIQGITDTEPLSSRAAVMKIYNRVIRELDSDAGAVRHSSELSEVDLSDPEDVKVTANDPAGTLAIHLGNADFLARYKLYLAHIAEWRQSYPNIQSVDLRYEGQVVVNPDAKRSGDRVIR